MSPIHRRSRGDVHALRRRGAWGGLVFLLLALVTCGAELPPGKPAAPFELERLEGGHVTLDDLRGRWVLLDFWATWCAPCIVEIPELNAFHAQVRDSGAGVLGIAVDGEDRERVRSFAEEHGIGYPLALGSEDVARRYGATAFPFHVLISPDGQVREALEPGFHSSEELLEILERHRRAGS